MRKGGGLSIRSKTASESRDEVGLAYEEAHMERKQLCLCSEADPGVWSEFTDAGSFVLTKGIRLRPGRAEPQV